MADDLLWRVEKDLRPRTPEDDCRECRRGETLPNALRSNWNDEWHASIGRAVIMRNHRDDVAMAALGKVNEALILWGYTLCCADALRDYRSGRTPTCAGSNCRAFVAMTLDDFQRSRNDGLDLKGARPW